MSKKTKYKEKYKRHSLCKDNISFLNYLNSISNSKKSKVIKTIATKNEVNAIIEFFLNFLNNNLNCKKKFIKSMKKNHNYFDKIMNKSQSLTNKKKLLVSPKGGFILSRILALAIPVLTKLFL